MWKSVVANDKPEPQLVIEESGGGHRVHSDETPLRKRSCDCSKLARLPGQGRCYVRESRSSQGIAAVAESEFRRVVAGTLGVRTNFFLFECGKNSLVYRLSGALVRVHGGL